MRSRAFALVLALALALAGGLMPRVQAACCAALRAEAAAAPAPACCCGTPDGKCCTATGPADGRAPQRPERDAPADPSPRLPDLAPSFALPPASAAALPGRGAAAGPESDAGFAGALGASRRHLRLVVLRD
jgi:hypothetical protein